MGGPVGTNRQGGQYVIVYDDQHLSSQEIYTSMVAQGVPDAKVTL
jgi:hypothetical protein